MIDWIWLNFILKNWHGMWT